jgi:hypothetical protein
MNHVSLLARALTAGAFTLAVVALPGCAVEPHDEDVGESADALTFRPEYVVGCSQLEGSRGGAARVPHAARSRCANVALLEARDSRHEAERLVPS